MIHPGIIGGTVLVVTGGVFLLGTADAAALTGTAANAGGTAVGIIVTSVDDLVGGFNEGKAAGNPAPAPAP